MPTGEEATATPTPEPLSLEEIELAVAQTLQAEISEPTETAVDQPKQLAGSTRHTKRHRRAVI